VFNKIFISFMRTEGSRAYSQKLTFLKKCTK
jgi:hypothetical protein